MKSSNNVDDMYAKVQKNANMSPRRSNPGGYDMVAGDDNLPVGASAMRTSAEILNNSGARPRLPNRHINYSDYEVAHYDPKNSKSGKKDSEKISDTELGYETVPDSRSRFHDHEGYEQLEDYWHNQNSGSDAGYELVGANNGSGQNSSKRRFDRLTFRNSSKKSSDPGYETVPPR